MDLFTAIERRRSVRAFKARPLREGDIERMLRAATLAPSAGNIQPWSFVVSTGKEKKEALAEAALGQEFVAEAPVVVTVCAMVEESAGRYGERGAGLYCLQDTAAAVVNLLLAATALGYAGCWVGAFDEGSVRRILRVPAEARPVALIPLGIPDEEPHLTERKPLGEVLHFEFFGGRKG